MTADQTAAAYFAAMRPRAMVVGHHAQTTRDGTVYHFYRGKVPGQSGAKSAPRALVVVEPNGNVRPAQPLGSYDRKKLRFFLKKHS
jgi:hypothetical protein